MRSTSRTRCTVATKREWSVLATRLRKRRSMAATSRSSSRAQRGKADVQATYSRGDSTGKGTTWRTAKRRGEREKAPLSLAQHRHDEVGAAAGVHGELLKSPSSTRAS